MTEPEQEAQAAPAEEAQVEAAQPTEADIESQAAAIDNASSEGGE